jgi:hypothetical protein
VADKNLMSLLKSYFNIQIKDKKIKNKPNVIKNRRLSTKRVFIGRGELKHSNNKVIITKYVYNTEAMFLWENVQKALEILYNPEKELEIFLHEDEDTKDKDKYKEEKSKYKSFNLENMLKEVFKFKHVLRTTTHKKSKKERNTIFFNKSDKTPLINKVFKKIKKIYKIIEKKEEIITFNRPLYLSNEQKLDINEDINNKRIIKLNRSLSLEEFMTQFDFKTYNDKVLKYISDKYSISLTNKEKLSLFNEIIIQIDEWYTYSHLLPLYLFMFNKAKFTMNFMEKLTHLVKNLYNKEVVFNIVNLKKMHLSSDIYTQAVALKLKNRDNKLYRVLKSSLRKIKIPDFSKITKKNKWNKDEFIVNKIRNSLINSMFTAEQEDAKDPLNNLLLNFFPSAENLKKSVVVKKGSVKNYSISLKDYVLMYLKHIKIRGLRVEAKGRLTRRFTASRSVFKMKWKGGLKNVDSSFKGLSTIMLRGYVKSNAQYTFISSKNRNGAFGVKGWVSNK